MLSRTLGPLPYLLYLQHLVRRINTENRVLLYCLKRCVYVCEYLCKKSLFKFDLISTFSIVSDRRKYFDKCQIRHFCLTFYLGLRQFSSLSFNILFILLCFYFLWGVINVSIYISTYWWLNWIIDLCTS